MIVKSTFRRAGGLEAHLLRSDTNESVLVRTDLFRGARDLNTALRLMVGLALTNPRTKRSVFHIVISPDHALDVSELGQALAMIEQEHGIAPDAPRAVLEHEKGARPNHFHAVYSIVDPSTGDCLKSHDNFTRDELISRRLELLFGERIIPGPRIEANIAELRRRGLEVEAECLAAHAPVRHEDGLSRKDRRQADRLEIEAQEWSHGAFVLFETCDRDLAAFAREIEGSGYALADGRSAMLIVDDATGFNVPLVRLLRREAKAAGRPLDIKEEELKTAFPDVLPLDAARDLGLERARRKAGREIDVEYRRATTEALVDGDVAALEAFRIRRRKQAKDEQARIQGEIGATLKARREAIQALYRKRDDARRRRVDRVFRRARLFETPEMRKIAFGLAATGVLLTGGSLGLAIAGGVVAMGLLPTRARARIMAASAKRERAEDAARRRIETDEAYRQARPAARPDKVRFTFEHVAKQDRVLAGLYAEAILRDTPLSADAMSAGQALGTEIVAGLIRMLERGSPLQVRRLQHWYRGIAPERRDGAVKAALSRHESVRGRTEPQTPGQQRKRPNARATGRSRSSRDGPEL